MTSPTHQYPPDKSSVRAALAAISAQAAEPAHRFAVQRVRKSLCSNACRKRLKGVANAPPSPPAKIALRKLLKFRLGVQLSADRGRKRDPKTGHVLGIRGTELGLALEDATELGRFDFGHYIPVTRSRKAGRSIGGRPPFTGRLSHLSGINLANCGPPRYALYSHTGDQIKRLVQSANLEFMEFIAYFQVTGDGSQ